MNKSVEFLTQSILDAADPTLASVNLAIAIVEVIRVVTPDGDQLLNHLDEVRTCLFGLHNRLTPDDDTD